MSSKQKVNVENGQGSQGEIDAPKGVSISLKTYARTASMVHWQMSHVTYLRDTSRSFGERATVPRLQQKSLDETFIKAAVYSFIYRKLLMVIIFMVSTFFTYELFRCITA